MKMKKVAVLGLVAMMGISCFTGCGKAKLPSEPDQMAVVVSQEMEKAKSYDLNGNFGFKGVAAGTEMNVTFDVNATYIKKDMKVKMTIENKDQNTKINIYGQKEEDDKYVLYMEADGTWSKKTSSLEENTDSNIMKFFANEDTSLYDGSEYITLSEKQEEEGCTSLDLAIPGDKLTEELQKYSEEASLAQNSGITADVFKNLGDIKATMVLDNKSLQWKSMTLDATELTQSIMDNIMEMTIAQYKETYGMTDKQIKELGMTVEISDCSGTLNYENINKAEDFEIPEEAKNAEEMETTEE